LGKIGEDVMENGIDGHRDEKVVEQAAAENVEREQNKPFWSRSRFIQIVIAMLITAIIAAILWFVFPKYQQYVLKASCQNNLRQLYLVLQMYANTSPHEKYPPAICVNGIWTIDLRSLYPEHLTDPDILICTADIDSKEKMKKAWEQTPPDWDTLHRMLAKQYVYFPWFVFQEEDFFEIIELPDFQNLPPDQDIDIKGKTTLRMRAGIERLLINEINNPGIYYLMRSRIPVAFDNPGNTSHIPSGINVLYMDGHIEFIPFNNKEPAVPSNTSHNREGDYAVFFDDHRRFIPFHSQFPATQALRDYYTEKTTALKNEP
jgi:prepilin-type processing-associated H-X9-DG protein